MFLMNPVPVRKTEARGALVDFYSKGSDNLKQLRDKGYVHIKAAIPMTEVWKLIAMFDARLNEGGFKGRFADPKSIKKLEDLPYGVWGLDNRWLAYSEAAMHARWLMRNVIAAEAGVDPETLVSSFDAVMATWPGYTNKPWFDPNDPRLPVKVDDKGKAAGPGHMDVCCDEECTARSHQCFFPMTPAEAHDMSTILLVPRGQWTLQGMIDACREKFPKAFDPTILNPKNHAREGFFFSPDVQEWLVHKGIARAIKPKLDPGDLLVWSSSLPHCAGAAKLPRKGVTRHPRLGVIAGFCPANLVSEEAQEIRRTLVHAQIAMGQGILRPEAHGAKPPKLKYIPHDQPWPEPYRSLRQSQLDVLQGKRPRAYEAREEDSEHEAKTKRRVRSLLGE